MYYLDAATAPIISLMPVAFSNKDGKDVLIDDFIRPTADRIALGIWSLQTDPLPDQTQYVVTGETYAPQIVAGSDQPSVMLRHWLTRYLTDDEKAAQKNAAIDMAVGKKCADIADHLDQLLQAGFADDDLHKVFKCDDSSLIRWNAVGSSALGAIVFNTQPAPVFELICTDNSKVYLNPAEAFGLLNGRAMPWVSKITLNARTHKDAVLALGQQGNLTDIANYDFSGGW